MKLYVLVHYDDFHFIVAESYEQAMKEAEKLIDSCWSKNWTHLHNIEEALEGYNVIVSRKEVNKNE